MQYLSSSHAKHSIGYHIIFCPKYRNAVFQKPVDVSLKTILHKTATCYGWKIHPLEVMPDHVHIFIQSDHTTAPVDIAKTLKSVSAVALFREYPTLKRKRFWGSGLWSRGVFYSAVGHISEDAVRKYIETQKLR